MSDLMEAFEELRSIPPSPHQQQIRAQFLQGAKQQTRRTSPTGFVVTGIAASLVVAFILGLITQRTEKPTADSIPVDRLVVMTSDNLKELKHLMTLDTAGVVDLQFTPDSLTLITVEENKTGSLWDLSAATIQPEIWTENPVYKVAVHPSEAIIGYLTDRPDSVFEFHRMTGADERKQSFPSSRTAFVYDPEGVLVTFNSGIDRVAWEDGLENSIGLRQLRGAYPGGNETYILSPDGQYLVKEECVALAYRDDTCVGRMGLWTLTTANEAPRTLGDPLPSLVGNAVTFTPDSQFVVMRRCQSPRSIFDGENPPDICDRHDIVIWDIAETIMVTIPSTCEQISEISTLSINQITVSVTCDGKTEIWDVDSQNGNSTLLHTFQNPVSDVTLSPDAQLLAFETSDGKTEIWGITDETSR